jgi:RNA polymerase sigma-70 factor, ECF subfamily
MKVLIKIPGNITEAEMLAGMLSGDQDCFSVIYDTYAARLFGLILKWAKEREKAEILLHDAFTKAWLNRKLFDAETEDFFCWLCSLARICYNEYYETV